MDKNRPREGEEEPMIAMALLLGAVVFAADLPPAVKLGAVAAFALLALRPRG